MHPEEVTPWMVLISTTIATFGVVGGAYLWLRRKAENAFVGAVNEAMRPLKDEVKGIADLVTRELTADHGQSMRDRVAQTLAMAQQTAAELPRTAEALKDAAVARAAVTDGKFDSLDRRLQLLEQRLARDTQRVVEAVQATSPPPAAGDGGAA